MNDSEDENSETQSKSRTPHLLDNESHLISTGQSSSEATRSRDHSLPSSSSSTSQTCKPSTTVSSWAALVNEKGLVGLGRSIINFEGIKIPRKATEGKRPLFDRDELRESIKRRVLENTDDITTPTVQNVQIVFPPTPTSTSVEESHSSQTHRENGRLSRTDHEPDRHHSSRRKSQSDILGSSISSYSSDSRAHVSRDLNDSISPDNYYNRSPRDMSSNETPRRKGPSPVLEIIRENERKRERRREWERECHRSLEHNKSRHSSYNSSVNTPKSGAAPELIPTKTLHVTWLHDVIVDPKRNRAALQHLNEVLRRHFQNLCDVPVLGVSYRPRSTWIMFKSINHAEEAMNQIRLGPNHFMYEFPDGSHHYKRESIPYEIDFSQSERWLEGS